MNIPTKRVYLRLKDVWQPIESYLSLLEDWKLQGFFYYLIIHLIIKIKKQFRI